MLEKDVEAAVVKAVKGLGGIAMKFTSPNRRSVPDRICLLPGGRVVFIECKRPGAKLTDKQAAEIERIRRLGFEVLVVDDVEMVSGIDYLTHLR